MFVTIGTKGIKGQIPRQDKAYSISLQIISVKVLEWAIGDVLMTDNDFDVRTDAFQQILATNSRIVRISSGSQFTEGPVWVAQPGYLLFSDISGNQIKRWAPEQGVSTWREPSGNANGNTLDRQGRLITCEHGNRRISRTERNGMVVTLADNYLGKKLNSPNDAFVTSNGIIWFTDPPYGIDPEQAEQPKQYVFRLDPDTGTLTPVAEDFERPNGLCFSPNEKLLYIADSSVVRHHIRVFDVLTDDTLANGRLFATIDPGVPDGITIDTEGRVYSTAGDGIHVFDPQGHLLGKILLHRTTINCTFGDIGKHTLFITANADVFSITLASTGSQNP